MTRDVLLIRSKQFHLAVPTDKLLEIVNLSVYHCEQDLQLETLTPHHVADQHRLWRNHVLPVVHLGNHLDIDNARDECPFSLVYQPTEHHTIYMDCDHVFGNASIDTAQMPPVYFCMTTSAIQKMPLNSNAPIIGYMLDS